MRTKVHHLPPPPLLIVIIINAMPPLSQPTKREMCSSSSLLVQLAAAHAGPPQPPGCYSALLPHHHRTCRSCLLLCSSACMAVGSGGGGAVRDGMCLKGNTQPLPHPLPHLTALHSRAKRSESYIASRIQCKAEADKRPMQRLSLNWQQQHPPALRNSMTPAHLHVTRVWGLQPLSLMPRLANPSRCNQMEAKS